MSKINKMLTAAADSGKPVTNPILMKPRPKENVSVKTMARAQTESSQFERLASNMIKNY